MSVRKNIFYNIINNISAVIFPFITVPYVSRVLGVENIGIVGFSIVFAQYFALVAALGIPLYGIKEIAKRKDMKEERSKLFSELFSLNLISSVICSVVYIIAVFTVPELYAKKDFMFLAGAMVYFSAFSFDWFFNGRENFKMITIRSVLVKILSVIFMFLLVRTAQDALYYCGITVMSLLLNNLWNFVYLIKREVKISFNGLLYRSHLKPLFTLLAINLAVSIYTILDTIMLGFMSDYTEVGYYNSAIRITRLLLPFAIATTSVLIPKITYALLENDAESYKYYLRRSFNTISFFSPPIAIGLIIIAPSFVPLFFGSQFNGTIVPMQILALVILFVGISNFFGLQVLVTANYESKQLICILIGTIINFTVNLFLIPRFGAKGAAFASVLAEFIIVITTAVAAYRYVKIKIDFRPLLQSLMSCIPMGILYFIMPQISYFVQLVVMILFGVFSYFIMQYILFKNELAYELFFRAKRVLIRRNI